MPGLGFKITAGGLCAALFHDFPDISQCSVVRRLRQHLGRIILAGIQVNILMAGFSIQRKILQLRAAELRPAARPNVLNASHLTVSVPSPDGRNMPYHKVGVRSCFAPQRKT